MMAKLNIWLCAINNDVAKDIKIKQDNPKKPKYPKLKNFKFNNFEKK